MTRAGPRQALLYILLVFGVWGWPGVAQQGTRGVSFQYPPEYDITLYYGDTVNVSYISPYASPIMITWCDDDIKNMGTVKAGPYNGSVLIKLDYMGVTRCWFNLRAGNVGGQGANSHSFYLVSASRIMATTVGFADLASTRTAVTTITEATGTATATTRSRSKSKSLSSTSRLAKTHSSSTSSSSTTTPSKSSTSLPRNSTIPSSSSYIAIAAPTGTNNNSTAAQDNTQNAESLDTAQKVGIGIGAGVCGCTLLAAVLVFGRKRRRLHDKNAANNPESAAFRTLGGEGPSPGYPGLPGNSGANRPSAYQLLIQHRGQQNLGTEGTQQHSLTAMSASSKSADSLKEVNVAAMKGYTCDSRVVELAVTPLEMEADLKPVELPTNR